MVVGFLECSSVSEYLSRMKRKFCLIPKKIQNKSTEFNEFNNSKYPKESLSIGNLTNSNVKFQTLGSEEDVNTIENSRIIHLAHGSEDLRTTFFVRLKMFH